jgi:hypothetical protein
LRLAAGSNTTSVKATEPLGYGVTAADRPDAEELVRSRLLGGHPLPDDAEVIEDVDVRELDANHVLLNMGDPSIRGVWYPRI